MLVYLAFSSGVMVNLHYCMNRLSSTELFSSAGLQCNKCGMHTEKSHGCCRDEVKIVKMDDDQRFAAVADLSIPAMEALIAVPSPFIDAPFVNATSFIPHAPHSPPDVTEQGLFVEIGVFRI